jgi:hypothetical protein
MKGNKSAGLLVIVIVIITVLIFCFGCNKEIVNQETNTVKKDSSYYFERWGANIEYLPLPQDTLRVKVPIDCPDQEIKVTDNKKDITIQIKDKRLSINIDGKKDSLRHINLFKESKEYKEATNVKESIKEVKTTVYINYKWAWYSLLANILFLLWITRKFWFRFIKG